VGLHRHRGGKRHGRDWRRFARKSPDLILLDVRLPDLSGIEVLREIKQNNLSIPVIMITGDPQLDDIKTAIKLGALDFIKKPLDFDELQITLANAIDRSRLRSERDSLRDEVRKRSGYHEVVGKSPRMLELMNFVRKVAASETSTVLIQGESGTGKDLVAKAIHYDSVRADKPFVPSTARPSRNLDGSRAFRARARRLYRRQGAEEGPV
jgi:two-component system, NtrC family, response regulator AtoC